MERPTSTSRALAAASCSWVACAWLASVVASTPGSLADPEWVVAVGAVSVGALAALLLACGCTALAAAGVLRVLGGTGRRLEAVGTRLTPTVVRRVLAVSLGAGLGLGLGPAAVADELDVGWQPTVADSATRADDGPPVVAPPPAAGPAEVVPARTTTPASDGADDPAGTAPDEVADEDADADREPHGDDGSGTHVVVSGESLWTIAAAHLPDDATDAEVARAWPRWWAENRDVVGADPDVIHPGQTLRLPDGASS